VLTDQKRAGKTHAQSKPSPKHPKVRIPRGRKSNEELRKTFGFGEGSKEKEEESFRRRLALRKKENPGSGRLIRG